MNKDHIRVRKLDFNKLVPGTLVIAIAQAGPESIAMFSPAMLDVYNDIDDTWYSVTFVSESDKPRILLSS